MECPATPVELLRDHLARAASTWSIGGYGALAEFARDADEPCDARPFEHTTPRGAIRVQPSAALAARAYEILSAGPGLWHHGVLFTLPQGRGTQPARTVVTELGPDGEAVRATDRDAILFDLGLGAASFGFCVRTADAALLRALRAGAGAPLLPQRELARALVDASPHRVAISRVARIEVFQPIAPPGGATPSGPHTHLMPRFLRPGHAASANIPLPAGSVPGLTLYPPHPGKDDAGNAKPFSPGEHETFQRLLERFGDPEILAAKRAVVAAVRASVAPSAFAWPAGRHARQAGRIVLRQLRLSQAGPAPRLDDWEAAFDRRASA